MALTLERLILPAGRGHPRQSPLRSRSDHGGWIWVRIALGPRSSDCYLFENFSKQPIPMAGECDQLYSGLVEVAKDLAEISASSSVPHRVD